MFFCRPCWVRTYQYGRSHNTHVAKEGEWFAHTTVRLRRNVRNIDLCFSKNKWENQKCVAFICVVRFFFFCISLITCNHTFLYTHTYDAMAFVKQLLDIYYSNVKIRSWLWLGFYLSEWDELTNWPHVAALKFFIWVRETTASVHLIL